MNRLEEIRNVVASVGYLDWKFSVRYLGDSVACATCNTTDVGDTTCTAHPRPLCELWVARERLDIFTGRMAVGESRHWLVTPTSSKSGIVQICFGAVLSVQEHEARENFLYRGRRIFGPHMDADRVWGVARSVDVIGEDA